ncbi:DUF1819 family protein [Priestia flexa]|uniref:BrxA family protein n=1 Tax=Priestia flexa TaxID=86664 RepID=UPI000C24411C|nr:BrxA family protein [Priestia flexa]MEC0666135.1 DUF1819 family protein [Priestia flexa]
MSKKYTADLKTTGAVLEDSHRILKRLYHLKSISTLEKELFENNLLLKASKRRIENVYGSIKKRYLLDANDFDISEYPLLLAVDHMSKEEAFFILYYHICLSDQLLYDFVVDIVFPRYIKGFLGVSNSESENFLLSSSTTHEEMKNWSERTYRDLKSALITVLLEIGFLKNRRNPVFEEALYISNRVFGYLIYFNKDSILTLEDLYSHNDFKLFLQDKQQRKLMIKELENSGIIHLEEQKETMINYKFPSLKEFVVQYVIGED